MSTIVSGASAIAAPTGPAQVVGVGVSSTSPTNPSEPLVPTPTVNAPPVYTIASTPDQLAAHAQGVATLHAIGTGRIPIAPVGPAPAKPVSPITLGAPPSEPTLGASPIDQPRLTPAIPPGLDDSGLDLHITDYNSVQLLDQWMTGVDDSLIQAQVTETAAYQSASDLSGQNITIAGNSSDADSAYSALGPNPYPQGVADVTTDQQNSAPIISQAGDALDSANQPLSILQEADTGNSVPATHYNTLQDFENTIPDWGQIPAKQQLQIIVQFCTANPENEWCDQYITR